VAIFERVIGIKSFLIWNFAAKPSCCGVVVYSTNEGRPAMHKISIAAFALALSVGSASLAMAEQPGPDWMPAQQVIENVLKSGYTQISKIEAEHGRWKGEGIKDGKKMDFHADPKTGAITSEKLDD
jgi:hypothetical protein